MQNTIPAPSQATFPSLNRLSVLTAVIFLGYSLARLIELPTRRIQANLFGSSIGIELQGQTLLVFLVGLLISSGAESLMRSHPYFKQHPVGWQTVLRWILPGLAAVGLGLLLNVLPIGPGWWLGLASSALLLISVLVAEYSNIDPKHANQRWARLWLQMLGYLVCLTLFGWLSYTGARSALTATGATLVATLISVRLAQLEQLGFASTIINATVVGLVVGQCLWALNYWYITAVGAALILVIVFYIVHSLLLLAQQQKLNRRTLIEFSIVGVLACITALQFAFRGLP